MENYTRRIQLCGILQCANQLTKGHASPFHVCRSNPDILRSNLDSDDITGDHHAWTETLRLHADAGSCVPTPIGSMEHLNELNDSTHSS